MVRAAEVILDGLNSRCLYRLCWRSADYIAGAIGRSRQRVVGYIRILEAAGLFSVRRMGRDELRAFALGRYGYLIADKHLPRSRHLINAYEPTWDCPAWQGRGLAPATLDEIRELEALDRRGGLRGRPVRRSDCLTGGDADCLTGETRSPGGDQEGPTVAPARRPGSGEEQRSCSDRAASCGPASGGDQSDESLSRRDGADAGWQVDEHDGYQRCPPEPGARPGPSAARRAASCGESGSGATGGAEADGGAEEALPDPGGFARFLARYEAIFGPLGDRPRALLREEWRRSLLGQRWAALLDALAANPFFLGRRAGRTGCPFAMAAAYLVGEEHGRKRWEGIVAGDGRFIHGSRRPLADRLALIWEAEEHTVAASLERLVAGVNRYCSVAAIEPEEYPAARLLAARLDEENAEEGWRPRPPEPDPAPEEVDDLLGMLYDEPEQFTCHAPANRPDEGDDRCRIDRDRAGQPCRRASSTGRSSRRRPRPCRSRRSLPSHQPHRPARRASARPSRPGRGE